MRTDFSKMTFYLLAVITAIILFGIICFILIVKVHSKRHQPFKINLDNILAYTRLPSYTQSDSIPVFVHTTHNAVAVLYRWGAALEKTSYIYTIPEQLQSTVFDPFDGFSWNVSFYIPANKLMSGYYFLKITQIQNTNNEYTLPIIIKPASSPRIAVIASTNTWQAYNSYGGLSNYENFRTPWYLKTIYWYSNYTDYIPPHFPFSRPYSFHKEFLSNDKPFQKTSSDFVPEWNIPAFLELKGYKEQYGVYSDFDISTDLSILSAEVVIFNVHSEYWSNTMMGMYKRYLQQGGKVIWASGNNMYREIENYEGGIMAANQKIPCAITIDMTGTYSFNAGYNTFAPYKIIDSKHWVYHGTNVSNNDLFGQYSALNTNEKQSGASGLETDKVGIGSEDYAILAIGKNKFGPAYMVFKETENGGWIFNASSCAFSSALTYDPVIDTMFTNLVEDALQKDKELQHNK